VDLSEWKRGEGPRGAPEIFRDADWQMSFGERAAFEGLLSQLRPGLAVEIGRAEGGSLQRIAAHTQEVHSLDLTEPHPRARELDNVHLHVGDSHEILPQLLARFASGGRNVDFAFVDGDHSAEGVRRDLLDLLDSAAVGRTVIILHDSLNDTVRTGILSADVDSNPKVAYFELDFLTGYLLPGDPAGECLWGGLALVIVDAERSRVGSDTVRQRRYGDPYPPLSAARDRELLPKRGWLRRLRRD
jgi:hypothetical protein